MTKPKQERRAADQSDNARRYEEWRNNHYFWKDRPDELDKRLDAQIAARRKKIREAA